VKTVAHRFCVLRDSAADEHGDYPISVAVSIPADLVRRPDEGDTP
jgi:hypothetical protein